MTLVNVLAMSAMVLVMGLIAGVTVARHRLARRRRGELVHPYEYPPSRTRHGWMG